MKIQILKSAVIALALSFSVATMFAQQPAKTEKKEAKTEKKDIKTKKKEAKVDKKEAKTNKK